MTRISLVVSDVDGTLVTHDKRLTDAAIAAVRHLADKKIAFTVTSSRPSFGMRMLVEPLGLKLPFGAFNGSLIVDPAFNVLQKDVIPADVARTAIDTLKSSDVDIWLFTADRWLTTRDDEHYVPHERNTILTDHGQVRQRSRNPECEFLKCHHTEAVAHSILADHASVNKRDISCACMPKTFPGLFFNEYSQRW